MPFAKHLFEAADRLRGLVESAEYKHLVLGLLFLKYVSDSFQLRRDQLEAETRKHGSGRMSRSSWNFVTAVPV
jgi:type I restriction enzyme M protein